MIELSVFIDCYLFHNGDEKNIAYCDAKIHYFILSHTIDSLLLISYINSK